MKHFQIADPVINAYVLLLYTSDIVARYAETQLSRLGITSTQYTILMMLSTFLFLDKRSLQSGERRESCDLWASQGKKTLWNGLRTLQGTTTKCEQRVVVG